MTETSDPFWKTADDARQYDELTRTRFACIYPVIADQIINRTGITRGACLDVGSGPAPLAIALAWISNLQVTALDSSPAMFALARENIRRGHMKDRVVPVIGDVHAIPAADATFNLVVSRGSYHSWNNLPVAFREILRVMKPGGTAYIGGGYGSARIRDEMLAGRSERGDADTSDHFARTRFRTLPADRIRAAIHDAEISDYRIISDDSGFWVIIQKNE
nr:class I SAM-dependent methyltransferase [uncultured Methanoregula sp.]